MPKFEKFNEVERAQLEDLKKRNAAQQAREKNLARPEGAPDNTAPERDPEVLQAWAEDLKNRTEVGHRREDNPDISDERAEEAGTMIDLAEGGNKISSRQQEVREDILDVLREQQGRVEDKSKQEDITEVLREQLGDKEEQKSKTNEAEKENKSKEQIVNEARKEYMKAMLALEAYKNPAKVSKKLEERVEDENKIKEYQSILIETRDRYFQAVSDWREELFDQVKQDMDGMNRKELNKELKSVINNTLVQEAIKVMELKQELGREMSVDKKGNWLGDKAKQIGNWYMKRPWYEKVAVGLGIWGGAALAVSVGGAAGMAIGGGVAAVGITRRTLASLSGYFGGSMAAEHATKRVQEWSNKREVNKKFSDALLHTFETKSQEFDKQLESFNFNREFQELINKSHEQQKSRNILKKTVGGILGASIFLMPSVVHAFGHEDAASGVRGGKAPRYPFGAVETGDAAPTHEVAPAPEASTPEAGHVGHEATTTAPAATAPEAGPKLSWETDPPKDFNPVYDTPSKGNVWNGLKEKMEARYGEAFTKLESGKQDHIIDKIIKSDISKHLDQYGLTNVNQIKVGQHIDFSSVFENKDVVAAAFKEAQGLSGSETYNIERYHQLLDEVKHGAGTAGHAVGHEVAQENIGPDELFSETPANPPESFKPLAGEYSSVKVDSDIQEQIQAQQAYEQAAQHAQENWTTQSAEFGPVWDSVMHGQIPLSGEELVAIKEWNVEALLKGERPVRPGGFFRRTFNSDWNRAWTRLVDLAKIHTEGMNPEDIKGMTVEQFMRAAAKA